MSEQHIELPPEPGAVTDLDHGVEGDPETLPDDDHAQGEQLMSTVMVEDDDPEDGEPS